MTSTIRASGQQLPPPSAALRASPGGDGMASSALVVEDDDYDETIEGNSSLPRKLFLNTVIFLFGCLPFFASNTAMIKRNEI